MGRARTITRRTFMGIGAAATGGFVIGYYYYRKPYENPLQAMAAEGEAVFNPYVKIARDNTVTIIAPRAEMGQGIQTTLATLVAEELEVDVDRVIVEHGPASPAYYNEAVMVDSGLYPFFDEGLMARINRRVMKVPAKFLAMQVTGGSTAIADGYVKMRQAGAAARLVLLQAAAQHWDIDADLLKIDDGVIHNPINREVLSYGDLAEAAAELSPPSDIKLRERSEWKQLGKSQARSEGLEKVTGAPIYAIDMQLPDMLYGTVKMSPRFGAGFKSYDPAPALALKGVQQVVEIYSDYGTGFGIIAENTWAAFKGAEALVVDWDDAVQPADSQSISATLDDALNGDPDFVLGQEGDIDQAIANAADSDLHQAEYEVPFLAHTTMEPMNATARFINGKLDVWVGSQGPGVAQSACAVILGIDSEDAEIHTTFMGGGFGRRIETDAAIYATVLAAKTAGRPVKVTWTREEDVQHDVYRPVAKARYRGVLQNGNLIGLEANVASPSVTASLVGRLFPAVQSIVSSGTDRTILDGSFDQPTEIEHRKYIGHATELPVPAGFWRSVGYSFNAFFHESFIDEMANKAGRDALEFRLSLLNEDEHLPAREVLKRVAEMSNWGSDLPKGKGRGLAHCLSFGTWVAQVIEVDVTDGTVTIEKVYCAADPGVVLDPANFEAQMISGIVYGLSQALGQEITIADGAVEQSNFHDFDAMHMYQCPEIEVAILENSHRIGGAGEPSTPPCIPALANAIFAASGKRIRRMPFSHEIDFI